MLYLYILAFLFIFNSKNPKSSEIRVFKQDEGSERNYTSQKLRNRGVSICDILEIEIRIRCV